MEAIEEVVVVDSLSEASELWKQYCRDELLYDSWGIRLRFSESEVTRPHFLKARFTDGAIGVLPLQWNESRSRYEFFGGVYMEGSSVLPHDLSPEKKRALYDRTPMPFFLGDIASGAPDIEGLEFEEYGYGASLKGLADADDFINSRFSGKSRNGLLKRLRIVRDKGVVVRRNRKDDIETLFRNNIKNFGDDSSFVQAERQSLFRELLDSDYETELSSYYFGEDLGGVSLSIRYRDTLVYMNAGVDKEQHPNLGTYVIYDNIQLAIAQGCSWFDGGVEDLGWKERWHLDRNSFYCRRG